MNALCVMTITIVVVRSGGGDDTVTVKQYKKAVSPLNFELFVLDALYIICTY